MNQTELDKTTKIIPVIRELFCTPNPDYKVVSLVLLQLLGLESLGQALQLRKQDWKEIAVSLLEMSNSFRSYQRCIEIIEGIRKHPNLSYQDLGDLIGYSATTVRQTVNLLVKGGIEISKIPNTTINGRSKTLTKINSKWRR